MSRSLIAYVATLIVFAVVDFVWLGVVAKDFYRKAIGHLMAEKPKLVAGIVFYLLFAVGLVFFAVVPGLRADSWQIAAGYAALFGFFCYATYDLTNFATLRGWPLSMVLADTAWGAFASAAGAAAGFFITRSLAG